MALIGSPVTFAASGSTAVGLVDSLGVDHPLLDVSEGWLPFVNRLLGSSESSPDGASNGIGHGAVRVGDYFKSWCEGHDNIPDNYHIQNNDATVPYQAARAALYPGHGDRFGEARLFNGQLNGASFGGAGTFENTSTRYSQSSNSSPCFGRKPRKICFRQTFKYFDNFPVINLAKFGAFINTRGHTNSLMLQCGAAYAGSGRGNWQGTPDNDLSNAANLGGLTNAPTGWNPNGTCTFGASDNGAGINEIWGKDLWWDKWIIARTHTWNGPYTCGPLGKDRCAGQTGDGWMKLYTRFSADPDNLGWSPFRRIAFWDRVLTGGNTTNGQTYWSNVVPHWQFVSGAGPYTGANTGIKVAGEWIWMSEFE